MADLGRAFIKSENARNVGKIGNFSDANRYEIELGLPSGLLGNVDLKNLGSTLIRCESVSFPGRNLRTQGDFNHYGPPLEIVHGLTFGEVALSFYANQDLDERVLFEEWQKLTYNTETYDIGYYQDYIGTISVFVLDRQDKRRYGVRLEEAYPKSIDPLPLSYSSGSTINRVGVSIQYRYWTNLATEVRDRSAED